ncbi:MAG: hypothetical protein KGL57_08405, partial [Burkholderiales bacterium]|nr:hypothetical protein [Burkholderiales bacterium]
MARALSAGILMTSLATAGLACASTALSISEQQLAQLADDATWIKLVHYETPFGLSNRWQSAIHSDSFFL